MAQRKARTAKKTAKVVTKKSATTRAKKTSKRKENPKKQAKTSSTSSSTSKSLNSQKTKARTGNAKAAKTPRPTQQKLNRSVAPVQPVEAISAAQAELVAKEVRKMINEKETKMEKSEIQSSGSQAGAAAVVAGLQDASRTLGRETTVSAGALKNFRHHPDIENFYRFIYDNDLRYEAVGIIDEILLAKRLKKAKSKKSP